MAPQLKVPSPPKGALKFAPKKSIPGIPRTRSMGASKTKKTLLASSKSFNLDSHDRKKQLLTSSRSFNLDRPLSCRKLQSSIESADSADVPVSTLLLPEATTTDHQKPTSAALVKPKPRLLTNIIILLCLIVLALIVERQDRVHSGFHLHHKAKLRHAMKVQVVGENTELMEEGQVMQVQVVSADKENGIVLVSPIGEAMEGDGNTNNGSEGKGVFKGEVSRPLSAAVLDLPILEEKERSIALIHVGKNGGSTLRKSTAITCISKKEDWMTDTQQRFKESRCINSHFTSDQKLAMETKYVFHMWALDPERIAQSTSFLIPLRNPVDRIVSTYRYSHPDNCNDSTRAQAPFGCHVERYMDKPRTDQYLLFKTCFPSPAMEDFAQSIKSPFSSTNFQNDQAWPKPKISNQMMQSCRKLARELVEGSRESPAVPHMHYNYHYYLQETLWKYPDKEVFVIRTEHELDDMVALDQQLGGSGKGLQQQTKNVSHGSEHYKPSPLSEEAYHKLCCVLENEIKLYLQVLNSAVNLDALAKQSSVDDLTQKCGVTTSWADWRATCQAELQDDLPLE